MTPKCDTFEPWGLSLQGFPKEQATFARISGYIEQTDIHSPQVRSPRWILH